MVQMWGFSTRWKYYFMLKMFEGGKMKKIFILGLFCMIFLIGLMTNVSSALGITEAHGVTLDLTDFNDGAYCGERIHTNQSIYVYNVTKDATDDGTHGAVLRSDWTYLSENATMDGNTANFSAPVLLNANTDYWVVSTAASGSRYCQYATSGFSYPINGITLNWTGSTAGLGTAYTNSVFSITQIGIVIETPPTEPNVTLISPVNEFNGTESTNYIVAIVTAIGGTSIVNVSLYFNDTINQTNTSTFSGVYYNFSIGMPDGEWNWSITAYSNESSKTDSATRNITIRRFLFQTNTFNYFALEQSSQKFYTNFTVRSGLTVSSVNITYNQTNYYGTFVAINSTFYNATATITLPPVTADTNKTLNWTVFLTDGQNSSMDYQQQVQDLGVDDCSAYSIMIFNYSLFDEDTSANMSAQSLNSTIKISLSLYPNASKTVATITYSHLYSETNPARICISDALGSSIFYVDSQVEYVADTYSREYYHIQNYSLNASSNPSQNITLYDLAVNNSQNFTITYKDSSFLPVVDALIHIQREYVDEGTFKVVEIPITSPSGETSASLVTNNVIYSFTVTKNGQVLATFQKFYAICQNPTIQKCEINLNSFSSSIPVTNFSLADDFVYTLTYNDVTRTISSTFSVPSGAVSFVSLNVTQETPLGTSVCNESVTSSSGTLNCAVGISVGNMTVIAKLYKDGDLIAKGQIKLDQDSSDIYGTVLVGLGIFVFLSLVGAGLSSNPILMIIFFIVGVAFLFAINLVSNSGFIGGTATILWLIVAIIIVLIKASRRS